MEWLTGKLLGVNKGVLIVIAAALLVWGIVAAFDHAVDAGIENAREAGAGAATIAGNKVTLDQIGAANDAGNDIRNDAGFARYCECLHSSTASTAGNCVRYLKHKPVPGGPPLDGAHCASTGR